MGDLADDIRDAVQGSGDGGSGGGGGGAVTLGYKAATLLVGVVVEMLALRTLYERDHLDGDAARPLRERLLNAADAAGETLPDGRIYLLTHLRELWKAVNFNWDVRGYFHWSLVDNFEWERGWTQPFGLWALDLVTQKRIKRPSADLYAEICRENGLSSEMVQKYCPEVFDKLFPV